MLQILLAGGQGPGREKKRKDSKKRRQAVKQMKYTGHATLDVDKKELRESCFPNCILQHSTFRLTLDAAGLGSTKMIMNDYY